ncbi:MAG: nucleotide exchange factor GrpE [Candidatus Latescibacteria bacterium]|nr:nucleotide exchange factor GrpE [Candidatus Latescibacterota bacterium]
MKRAESKEKKVEKETEKQDIAALEQQLAEMEDRLLRATAEFENYKKRRQRESAELLRYGHETLIRDLLPVLDSFERAILSSEGNRDYQAFHDGVELILQQMREVLRGAGVERVWPEGEQFDPHRHEAIGVCSHEELEPDHIATVVEPGYEIHGRVVRPPKVLIVRSDTEEPESVEPESEEPDSEKPESE